MRVGIVCAFDTYFDRVKLLKEYYESNGNSVLVFGSNFSHRKKTKVNYELIDVEVDTRPYYKNLSISRMYSHYTFSRDVIKRLEKEEIEAIHVLIPCNSLVKFVAEYKKNHQDVKVIFDIIDLWPETMPISKFKDVFPFTVWKNLRDNDLDCADLVLTECYLFQEVLGKTNNPKYRTLYWARSEIPMQRHLNLKQDELRFCYLGSMNNIIDIGFIENLLSECAKYRKVSLSLIGDGETKQNLISRVRSRGIEVIDHGKVYDQDEKQKIFDSCNYGLNVMKPSVVVGLTMKSLDYMCGQLPIVSTIEGDTKEFCEKINIGFHITHDQIQVKAQKLCSQTLIEQEKQRDNIKELYLKLFTKDSFYRELDESWEKIL